MMDPMQNNISGSKSRATRGDGTMSQETTTRPQAMSPVSNARSEDSWIEVASQASSSSLSSAGANDEIVTTGLRIRPHRTRHGMRRPVNPQELDITYSHRQPAVNESSQDEYEETESESDRVMTSSNEDIGNRPRQPVTFLPGNSSTSDLALSSDDDDNLTALGLRNPPAFAPQPNAFSHPPTSQTELGSQTACAPSNVARMETRVRSRRNSRTSVHSVRRVRSQQQNQQHSPYNMYSPSHHIDHDAALRASLSTLLSYATAARGLPKRDNQNAVAEAPTSSAAVGPSTFRLVPESAVTDNDEADENQTLKKPEFKTVNSPSSKRARSPVKSQNKSRRKASLSKERSKKLRRGIATEPNSLLTPTVMTWVISAGVVVLFSAISFSAGYVLGREVGKTEVGHGLYPNANGLSDARSSAGCGKDAVKGGLRQFRWVGGGSGSGIAA